MSNVFEGSYKSHVGNVRSVNQDNGLISESVMVVADGLGGHRGGGRAAELASEPFKEFNPALSPDELVEFVSEINNVVWEGGSDFRYLDMGTTLVAAVLHPEGGLSIVNVGDSRAYILHEGKMVQITKDHSYVARLLSDGYISEEEALSHPSRNIVEKALGLTPNVEPDVFSPSYAVGDRLLLCSDGLTNEVTDSEILEILQSNSDTKVAASALVDAALANEGRDNVTVVVADIK